MLEFVLLYRFYIDVLFLEVYLCFCDVLFVFIVIDLVKMLCSLIFSMLKTVASGHCFKIFPRFFSIVKLPIQTRNTREVLMRGGSGLRSLKRL